MHRIFILIAALAFVSNARGVDFGLNANKVVLPVRVNDRGPYWFILDTGSVTNVVDVERARSLGIVPRGSYQVRGAGEGSLPASVAKNVRLRFGDISLPEQDVETLPINKAISFSEGRAIDGLLGCPFFERFIVEIDYANRQLSVHEPQEFKYASEGETIPIDLERGNIFIQAVLVLPNGERVKARFLVDTGWRAALSLTSPFVKDRQLLGMTPTIAATTGVGIGGPTRDPVGRVSAIEIGRYIIEKPVASFSEAKSGVLAEGGMSGIIGGDILRRFKVIFDYPHRQMILEPNAYFGEPYQFDMSGLFVTVEGHDLRTFRVFSVIAKSPGSEAGVSPGDVIQTIDDQPADNFTLEQLRTLFKQEAKEHLLRILRGRQSWQTKLVTRKLI